MTREQLKEEAIQFIRNRKYLAEHAVSSSGELLREDHAMVADLISRQDAYIDELFRINKLAQTRIKLLCEMEVTCNRCNNK